MTENARLKKFRDAVLAVSNRNCVEISVAAGFTDKENAGTLLLVAQGAIGVAAAAMAKTDPELAKLSPNGQILNVLELLTEIHQKPARPNLTVVEKAHD